MQRKEGREGSQGGNGVVVAITRYGQHPDKTMVVHIECPPVPQRQQQKGLTSPPVGDSKRLYRPNFIDEDAHVLRHLVFFFFLGGGGLQMGEKGYVTTSRIYRYVEF